MLELRAGRRSARFGDVNFKAGKKVMESSLAAMVATGSEFFVLPRLYGSVKIPAKFGFQLKDDELLTYSMASCPLFFVFDSCAFVTVGSRRYKLFLKLYVLHSKR